MGACALPPGLPVFVEVPTRTDPGSSPEVPVGWAAKLRCGGVRADLFPSPQHLAEMIAAVVRHGLAAKATAGLHHAIGYRDPATGFDHFGFLNLLLAVHRALTGRTPDDLVAVLRSRDEAGLVAEARALNATEAAAVRRTFISYGSCSTEEPIEDLERFGTAPATNRALTRASRRLVMADYQSGFGNSFETEALPGALPIGPQLTAAVRVRSLRRAAQRLTVHRPAGQQRAVLAVPDPADRRPLGPVRQGRLRAVEERARTAMSRCRSGRCAGTRSRSRTPQQPDRRAAHHHHRR